MNDLAKSFFIAALNAEVSLHQGEGATLSLLVTCTPAAADGSQTQAGGTQSGYR